MKITSGNKTIITTTQWHFDYFEVIKDVFAYRVETSSIRDDATKTPEPVILQGVTNRKGLTQLRKGNHPQRIIGLFVCPDDLLIDIKRFGYMGVSARNFKGMDDEAVYEFLANGGSPDSVIRFQGNDHSFWRLDGTLLPTGIPFDYISARFHNLCYDLPKAVAHLNDRDDVAFFDVESRGRRFGESLSEAVMSTGAVSRIPYYNADAGKNAYLSFCWTPSQAQAEKLQKDHTNRFKIVFDDDMLGLRAAGAALFDAFYDEIEIERSEEDWSHD